MTEESMNVTTLRNVDESMNVTTLRNVDDYKNTSRQELKNTGKVKYLVFNNLIMHYF